LFFTHRGVGWFASREYPTGALAFASSARGLLEPRGNPRRFGRMRERSLAPVQTPASAQRTRVFLAISTAPLGSAASADIASPRRTPRARRRNLPILRRLEEH
jgi:hypothetical protein